MGVRCECDKFQRDASGHRHKIGLLVCTPLQFLRSLHVLIGRQYSARVLVPATTVVAAAAAADNLIKFVRQQKLCRRHSSAASYDYRVSISDFTLGGKACVRYHTATTHARTHGPTKWHLISIAVIANSQALHNGRLQ